MGGSSLKNLQVKKYSALRYFWKSAFFWLSYIKCLKRFNRAGGMLRNGWKKKEFNEYLTYFFLFHSFFTPFSDMLNKPSELIQIQCLKCFYPIMLIPVGVAKVCVYEFVKWLHIIDVGSREPGSLRVSGAWKTLCSCGKSDLHFIPFHVNFFITNEPGKQMWRKTFFAVFPGHIKLIIFQIKIKWKTDVVNLFTICKAFMMILLRLGFHLHYSCLSRMEC